jgi:hypothetical protein
MDIKTMYNCTVDSSRCLSIGTEETQSLISIASAANQRFVIDQAASDASPITISEGDTAQIGTTNNILIAIATTSGFGMEWDTSITSVTISGTASAKVSSTVSYVGASVLKITVNSNFSSHDSITISGLKYKNFTGPAKSNTGALHLFTNGTINVVATSTQIVTISLGKGTRINKPPNYLSTNQNLTTWQTFDGPYLTPNVVDKSGQGNHGNLSGQTSTTSTPGKLGQALEFDGVDDQVVGTSDFIDTGADSITAWIKPKSLGESSVGRIVDNGQIRLYVSSGNTISFSSDGGGTVAASASSVFSFNQWTFVVATRNASGVANIYINGVLSGSANQSSGIPASGLTNVVFGNNIATTNTFDGALDDVRIYARTLSAAEVLQLYGLGSVRIRP